MSNAVFAPMNFSYANALSVPSTRGPFTVGGGVAVSNGRLPTDSIGNFALTLTNLVVGSAISVEAYSTGQQLFFGVAASTTQLINLGVYQSGDPKNDLRIKVRQGTTAPYYKPYETRQMAIVGSASLYIDQQLD
jgi:lipid-binding SYLF domain-containing protein